MEAQGPNTKLTKSKSVFAIARWFIGMSFKNVTLGNTTVVLERKGNDLA